MSSNTLVAKITADTEAKVAAIKAEADAEVKAIEAETESRLAALESEAAAALDKKRQQAELVIISKAKQESKIALQRAKREAIDGIFADVFKELTSLSSDEYVTFFGAQATQVIPQGVTIKKVVAPKDRNVETAKIIENLGQTAPVGTDARITAGFIAHTDDGVYDLSFDRIFTEKRVELEMDIVNRISS
jgi:vacuolar-type H+-ATPase subunit E/Vma4